MQWKVRVKKSKKAAGASKIQYPKSDLPVVLIYEMVASIITLLSILLECVFPYRRRLQRDVSSILARLISEMSQILPNTRKE